MSPQQAHKIDYISHLFYSLEVDSPTSYISWLGRSLLDHVGQYQQGGVVLVIMMDDFEL